MKKGRFTRKYPLREMLTAYLLLSPAVLLFLVIGLFTVLFSLWLSFHHLKQGSLISSATFAGVDNFRDFLFGESPVLARRFRQALVNNLVIAVSMVSFVIIISLFLAALLQKITRGVKIFRTVFLVPMITSSVAIVYVWQGIFEPNGSLNNVLNALGLSQFVATNGWLGEISTALPAIITILVWGGIPGTLILYFAGLQTVDQHLYEAAEIDGANAWKKMLHITWPALKPITIVAVVFNLNGAFQVFDQIWITTKGGPAGATTVVNVLIYQEAFGGGDMGRANAMGWTIFVLTFFLSLFSMRALKDNK